jgi:hypothetical protein
MMSESSGTGEALTPAARLEDEVLASALQVDQVIWGFIDGDSARLASGVDLVLDGPPPDGIAGWRRLRVVDPASLRVRVLEIPATRVDPTPTDDPATLWELPSSDRTGNPRVPPFPVGEGFDPVLALYVAAGIIVALVIALIVAILP